jgi:CRISPR-associated protein Cas1
MRTLYLLRSHGTAALDGEQLVVRSDDQELDRTPLPQLDQILVMGQQELSTPLIHACLGVCGKTRKKGRILPQTG